MQMQFPVMVGGLLGTKLYENSACAAKFCSMFYNQLIIPVHLLWSIDCFHLHSGIFILSLVRLTNDAYMHPEISS